MKRKSAEFRNQNRGGRIGLCMGLVLLFCCLGFAPALANVLELPSALTEIADEAFMNDTSITSVVIPEGTTSIGARAFAGCGNLANIKVPDSVTAISEDAFDGCDALRISAPEGSYAYEWAMNKGYIEIPATPIEYFTYAIDDGECTITGYIGSATDVVIPDEIEKSPVTCIGPSAFSDCSHLISISIPDGVRRVREFAFENCSSLKSINIPDGVTSIANWVFSGCSSLASVDIPDGVTTIWHDAFSGCSSLVSIDIPDGVTSIESSTFRDCSSLKSIDIPSGVISIENGAFWGCSSLESVDIPDGVTSIESSAFRDCSSLTSINIPDGVMSIKQGAFENCSSLISIDIPDGVTSIEGEAFWGCSSLESIEIPDGVTSIAEWLFAGCTSLKSIDIPAGVTSIGNYAFIDCSSLISIDIPVGVTSIGQSAFTNCSSLTSIDIPDGVASLEYMAFYGCSSLVSIDMPDGMTSLGEYAFCDCSSLTSIDIPDGVTNIADYTFRNCSSLISVNIPYGVTSIGEDAFWNCSSLESIDIPDRVTSIGKGAFTYCNSLKNIVIPAGVTSIEDSTFNSCSSLISVDIPDGVTSIGKYAFSWCDSLTSILIPALVESIAETAFSSCFNLTIYGVSGSYAETYAAENGIAFVATEENPILSSFGIYSPAANEVLSSPTVEILWQGQSMADRYTISLYEVSDDGALTAILTDYETDETSVERTLEHGKTYQVEVTATNAYTTITCTRVFSVAAYEDSPRVVSFSMEKNSVQTGEAAVFSVETANATYVQLVVDGEYYDSLPVTSNPMTMGRVFTLDGERQVSFRAYGDGIWSEACEAQVLTVTAEGALDAPQASCESKIWLGDTLTVNWNAVENANGYVLYLNYPDGTSQGVGVKLSADTLSYTYESDAFAVTGEYSVRVMAYGAGYSQSSALAWFTVTDEYIVWEGWPQSSKVNTYETADSTTANGYVDYLDPVTVLGEEGDCYYIEMTLTDGGTAKRYVRKYDIGTEQYTPGLTLSASYARGANGELYLYANTNLVSSKAGVELNGEPLGTLYTPTTTRLYTNVYAFSVLPITGTTTYTVWAQDAEGNRLTKEIEITIAETTPTPEITPTPTPEVTAAPDGETTPTLTPTPTPTPTITPVPDRDEGIIVPDEEVIKEPDTSCTYETVSGHEMEYVILKNMSLTLADNGKIRVDSATCPECGGVIADFGYVPENVQTQFYFHPIARYYDTSGNGQVFSMNHDYRRVTVNEDLTITDDIDLNGAPLTVNGTLRIEGTLSDVSEIRCYELIIENEGVLQAESAEYIRASSATWLGSVSAGGKVEIKNGGQMLIHPDAMVKCDGDVVINGTLSGGSAVNCKSLSVGSNGIMGLSDGFIATISKDFTFKSGYSHASSFGESSKLVIHGDVRISGGQFGFDGTCYLKETGQLVKMEENDGNYFANLDMTEGGSMLTVNEKETELVNNNWNDGNSFKAKNLEGSLIDSPAEAVVKKFFDFILIDPLKSGSGIAWIQGKADFIKPLLTTSLTVDEEAYRQLLYEDVGDPKEVNPADVITGEIGLVTFDDKDSRTELENAIRYGLMTEMFIKQGTHYFDFEGFSLNFDQIKGDSLWYGYNGNTYTMELTGFSMETSTQDVSKEIYFIQGELIQASGKRNTFSYTTNLQELNDAALLLQAAGTAEAIAELESTLDIIIDSAKEGLKMLDMFDEFDYKQKLKKFVYEHCSVKIQEVVDWVEWIDGEIADEKELFKDFKKFYDLSLKFYPPQPES